MLRPSDLQSSAPTRARWLTVSAVREPLALARLRGEWAALHEASGAGLFNAWEWLHPWTQRVAPGRALHVLVARDRDGALCGVLPLGLEVRRVLGRRVRRLAFLGETHVGSDYLDVVARPEARAEVTAAFASYLRDTQAEWDVLDLLDLDADSPTLGALREAFGRGGHTLEQRERYVCPYEVLTPGESFDAFLKRTGRRDNYLRRRKWLEKQEGFRIERTEQPAALAQPLSAFFGLHAARWAGDGGSQGIKGPGVEAFHRDATQLLAERGKVWLYTLWVGPTPVASVYGLVHKGTFIYFQSGYDPAWRNRSVGLVLVGQTFKDAIEAGLTEYDFLRGTESYKADWTTRQRRTVALRIALQGGPGGLLTAQEDGAKRLRDAVKRVLPTDLTERIRRIRRRRSAI
jgi:CelD/BcsL family acetyltransferase involved in cellulose biosynthesis